MAKKSKTTTDSDVAIDFERALDQLQSIVRELESGQLTLDQSLAKYELGVACLRNCHQALQRAELRIRQLVEVDVDGRATTKPFAHSASTEKPSRSRSKKPAGDDDEEVTDEDIDFDDEFDDADDADSQSNGGNQLF